MLSLRQEEKLTNKLMHILCSCGKETSFSGPACPLVCHHCSDPLPDALDIHKNVAERKTYHFDEEIFA